jgi:hypothetical protein
MLDPLTDLFARDGFGTAVAFGLAASVVVALVALPARRVLPLAGLAFGVAAVLTLDDRYGVDDRVVVALAVLAGGGLVADALAAGGLLDGRWSPLAFGVVAVPGAVLFDRATELDRLDWTRTTVVAVTVVGGALAAAGDRAYAARGVGPVLLAITTFGVYVTTPDTEHTALVLGAALPVALLGWPRPLASLGVGGALVATAVVTWNVVLDGSARPGAVVGGVACLGMLVIVPVVAAVWRPAGGGPTVSLAQAALVAALHLAVVAVCSRVAGLRESATEALVISGLAYVAAAAGLVWGTRVLDDRAPTAGTVPDRDPGATQGPAPAHARRTP